MKKLFLLIVALAIFTTPALADRSMAGSTCTLITPDTVDPGDIAWFQFEVCNGSVDYEWLTSVTLTFPQCFTVLSGYDDYLGGTYIFSANANIALFDDPDGGWGEMEGGECANFFVEVEVGADCECGPANVHFYLQGDIYGDEPHFVEGDCPFTICETATEDSSWSTVKGLY